MARVVEAAFVGAPTLGAPWVAEVFTTGAPDVAGVASSEEMAKRLTLIDETGALRSGPFAVIAFDTPVTGIASPVRRTNPGFINGGRTAGDAREFVIPNYRISDLKNVTVHILP